jgi:hypothetical protein
MRGATADSRIHLNQSTNIYTKSATLFIAVRGVAFIFLFFFFFLIAVTPSHAASGSFNNANISTAHWAYEGFTYTDYDTWPHVTKYIDFPANFTFSLTVLQSGLYPTSHSVYVGLYNVDTGLYYFFLPSYFIGINGVYYANNVNFPDGNYRLASKTVIRKVGDDSGGAYLHYRNVSFVDSSVPTLPESNGIISFDKNSYDSIDTVSIDLTDTGNETFIDGSSYDCIGSTCSWQPTYHWSALNPLFYYQDVPIVRVLEGTYEYDTWYTIDTNPFLESGVSLVQSPYSNVLLYQYTILKI